MHDAGICDFGASVPQILVQKVFGKRPLHCCFFHSHGNFALSTGLSRKSDNEQHIHYGFNCCICIGYDEAI